MEKKDYVTQDSFDKLKENMNKRFDEVTASMSKQFAEVNKRFDEMIDAIGHYTSGSERKLNREVYVSRTHARDLVREHEKAMH